MSPLIIDLDPSTGPVGYHRFHQDRSLNFQCNRFLQWLGSEALDEIATAAGRIHGYDDWISVFLELAARARGEGRLLAGAYYDRAAEFFMRSEDPRRAPARERFVQELRRLFGVGEPDAVPYGRESLPAYDLQPAGAVRGTIVAFGGFDSYVEEFLPMLCALAGVGYRVVAFDGPGQGGPLEEAGLSLTTDWERPVAAVLDHYALDDVTLLGISLGGGLAIRAAAFEPRARRVIADDVLDNLLECVGRQIGPGATPVLRLLLAIRARQLVDLLARAAANRKPIAHWGLTQGLHVTGTQSPYDFLRAAQGHTTRTISAQVTADTLLLAAADDHYVPRHQLHRQAAALANARSVTTRLFTAADQAHNHCHIGYIAISLRVMLSWLDSLQSNADKTEPRP